MRPHRLLTHGKTINLQAEQAVSSDIMREEGIFVGGPPGVVVASEGVASGPHTHARGHRVSEVRRRTQAPREAAGGGGGGGVAPKLLHLCSYGVLTNTCSSRASSSLLMRHLSTMGWV